MMSLYRLRRAACAISLGFAVSGCGASTQTLPLASGIPSAQDGASLQHRHQTTLLLRFRIPRHRRHRAKFVSPSTQSFVWIATGPSPNTSIAGSGAINVTPASPSCSQSGALQYFTCTETASIRVTKSGAYAFTIAAYDAQQSCGNSGVCATAPCTPGTTGGTACAGNELSNQSASEPLTLGAANTLSLTLGADAAGTTVTPLPVSGATNGFLRGDASGLSLWGPSTQDIAVEAVDADGNTIVGPGAPGISVTSSSATLTVHAVTGSSSEFTIAATTSSSLVTPGLVALSVHLTAPASGGGSLPSTNPMRVPVRIAHAAVYVTTQSPGQLLGYFDGATAAPSVTISGGNTLLSIPSGVGTDGLGNIYVADRGANDLLEFGPTSTGDTTPSNEVSLQGEWTFGPAQIAVTSGGGVVLVGVSNGGGSPSNLYVTQGTGIFGAYSGTTQTLGVAIDSCGEVTSVTGKAITPNVFLAFPTICSIYTGSPAPGACACNSPTSLAFDSSNDLYVADTNGSIYEYPSGANGNAFGSPERTISGGSTGLVSPVGLAIDAAGTIYAVNPGRTTVTEYAPGSNGNVAPSATLSVTTGTPIYVTAVPPAMQF